MGQRLTLAIARIPPIIAVEPLCRLFLVWDLALVQGPERSLSRRAFGGGIPLQAQRGTLGHGHRRRARAGGDVTGVAGGGGATGAAGGGGAGVSAVVASARLGFLLEHLQAGIRQRKALLRARPHRARQGRDPLRPVRLPP